MTLEAGKEMDRRCVMDWLNEVYVTPSRAFEKYTEDELKMFAHDALVLLKEQEAVEPTFKQGEDGIFVWACGSCGAYMYHIYDGIDKAKEYAKYCRQCGKKVKWE
jgi:hypothetical protein